MDFRGGGGRGRGGEGLPVEVCVACAVVEAEKALRARGALGWMRGSRSVGRSSAIASAGLYTAAMAGRGGGDVRLDRGGEGRGARGEWRDAERRSEAGGRRRRMQPRPRLQTLTFLLLPLLLLVAGRSLEASPTFVSTAHARSLSFSLSPPSAASAALSTRICRALLIGTPSAIHHEFQQEEHPHGLSPRHPHGRRCCTLPPTAP